MSSRNRFLSAEERVKAPRLHAALQAVAKALAGHTTLHEINKVTFVEVA